jgi:hypothetical protein
MFLYSDPTDTGLLERSHALGLYRAMVHSWYRTLSRLPNSAFTLLDAFENVPLASISNSTVEWSAFPVTAPASHAEIDRERLRFQDEYVEWLVEREASGKLSRITFTTEFLEYYEALAQVGLASLIEGVAAAVPGASPTAADLFGNGFDPNSASPDASAAQFRSHAVANPWNNGQKGILALTQQFNTMGALFNLAGRCAVSDPTRPVSSVCGAIGGFCGPDRNSDPAICQAIQNLSRGMNGLSLADPVGVRILRLAGDWAIDGRPFDINGRQDEGSIWTISRNGRRAVLALSDAVTMDGSQIQSGAQVANNLFVGATVISAPDSALPAWARAGQESSRRIT